MQRRAFEFGGKGAIASANGRAKRPAEVAKSRTGTSDMRLICPNCSAQYEVDGSLIPDEGRDVQCSNCGHNWFELPPAVEATTPPPEMEVEDDVGKPSPAVNEPAEPEYEAEAEVYDDPEPNPEPEQEPETASGPEHSKEPDVEPTPEAESEADPYRPEEDTDWDWPKTRLLGFESSDEASAGTEAEPASLPDRPRRPVDVAALEILKEEADRELAKRKVPPEPEPIEVQPDLVPAEDPRDRESPSRALRARMARLRGEDEEAESEAEAKAEAAEQEEAYREPRKDLLPDIDEINSSLRPAGLARGERSEEEEEEHRRGFRVGFLGMVAAAVLAIIAYAQAPAIAGVLPGTETALIGYVDWANGVRDALTGLFGG